MRAVIIALLLFAFGGPTVAQTIGVTSNVLKRVKRIIAGPATGTAFTMDVDGRQYLVTAKHVVATLASPHDKIQVCGDDGKCVEEEVSVLRCADPIDIAVLVPRHLLTVTFSLPADMSGMLLGQDVYFVGFPYADTALTTNTAAGENIGFVRKAIWSAQERKSGYSRLYLDGRNNLGFSGSPVVFTEPGKPLDFKVAAVISGYRSDYTNVLKVTPILPAQITAEDRALSRIIDLPNGTHVKLTPSGDVVPENTGIILSYDIGHAVELIRAGNVKGPEAK